MIVAITHPRTIRHAEPCIVTGEAGVWENAGENEKDEFIRKFENYENEMNKVSIRPKEPMREVALGLVWGAGDRPGRFLRLCVSLVSNVEVFSR